MRQSDIANALESRLALAPSLGLIVWENKDAAPPPAPYLIFENVRTTAEDATLAGGAYTSSGYLMISVVSKTDVFATAATALADNIAERFAYGLRLSAGTGHVLITKPPFILKGYPDGVNFRVPVRIDYSASGEGGFANEPIAPASPTISSDPGNILEPGTDGGLFVPPDEFVSVDLGTFN